MKIENDTEKRLKKNTKIAVTAALSALIILMGIPGLHLGYIPLTPTVSTTIMHIPVILASILTGYIGGLTTALVFGVTSLLNAALNPLGALDPLFVNPLVSILPRLLFGLFSAFLYSFLFFLPKKLSLIKAAFTAFIASVFHSWITIGALYLFMGEKTVEALGGAGYFAFIALHLPFTALDGGTAAIITVAVLGAMNASGGVSKLYKKSKKSAREKR